LRTSKINSLYKKINFLNLDIVPIGIDTSPLDSNAWLAGFIEADGNFTVSYELNKKGFIVKTKCYMRISQAIYNTVTKEDNITYKKMISIFLKVKNLNTSVRVRSSELTTSTYEIRAMNKESCNIVISYFNQFP
jgi:hypothetical protein